MPSLLVRFDAELRLVDDEVPETLDYATIQQAVQDSIGFTGVTVIDVTEHEHQGSDARSGDRPSRPETTDLPVYGLLYMLTEAAERSLAGCIQHKWQFSAICPICLSIRDDLKAAVARVTEVLR